MKKTKEVKEESAIEKILQFTSQEDAEEFKRVANGRKFCKKGERLQDICDEELARYEYENNTGFFARIFKHHKFKKNKERLMLESRITSVIRAIASEYINSSEEEQIKRNELIEKVKSTILELIKKYEGESKKA